MYHECGHELFCLYCGRKVLAGTVEVASEDVRAAVEKVLIEPILASIPREGLIDAFELARRVEQAASNLLRGPRGGQGVDGNLVYTYVELLSSLSRKIFGRLGERR